MDEDPHLVLFIPQACSFVSLFRHRAFPCEICSLPFQLRRDPLIVGALVPPVWPLQYDQIELFKFGVLTTDLVILIVLPMFNFEFANISGNIPKHVISPLNASAA